MKKNFKIVSLLTVVTIVVNILLVLVMLRPASAVLTDVSDTMDSLKVGKASVHTIARTSVSSNNTKITFWSSNKSAQKVRGYLGLAADINGTIKPGTYTDVLQFIDSATY